METMSKKMHRILSDFPSRNQVNNSLRPPIHISTLLPAPDSLLLLFLLRVLQLCTFAGQRKRETRWKWETQASDRAREYAKRRDADDYVYSHSRDNRRSVRGEKTAKEEIMRRRAFAYSSSRHVPVDPSFAIITMPSRVDAWLSLNFPCSLSLALSLTATMYWSRRIIVGLVAGTQEQGISLSLLEMQ